MKHIDIIIKMINFKLWILIAIFILISQQFTFGQSIKFEKDLYDFGQVCYDSTQPKHSCVLRFKNTGSDTLIIYSQPTTGSNVDIAYIYDGKFKYAPNEEGVLIYQFDTKSSMKFINTITIQSNSSPSATIVRVKWQVLPEVICKHLEVLAWYNCFNMPTIDPIIFAPPTPCDSIRNLAVNEVLKLYTTQELFDLLIKNESQSIDIIAFEALTQLCNSSDTITHILESYFLKLYNQQTTSQFFGIDRLGSYYSEMCQLVSPYDKSYSKSKKINEEQYAFLFSLHCIYRSKYLPYWGNASSFYTNPLDTIDFGTIDLSNFSGDKFVLKGRIRVFNTSNKQLIIAPYYDNVTQCEKKSYRLGVNDTIEINFKSKINISNARGVVKRAIKVVNYQTKEEATVWIKANFINYNE